MAPNASAKMAKKWIPAEEISRTRSEQRISFCQKVVRTAEVTASEISKDRSWGQIFANESKVGVVVIWTNEDIC